MHRQGRPIPLILVAAIAVTVTVGGLVAVGLPGASPAMAPSATGDVLARQRPRATPKPTPRPTTKPTPRPTAKPTPRPSATATPRPTPSTTPSPAPTGSAPAGTGPTIGGCPLLPVTNVWNKPVDTLPVRSDSATMIAAIGATAGLHPDFSNEGGYGIPFNIVGSSTPRSTVTFEYDDESDHVGYPIPASPKIESGSDRHILMVDADACRLYELYAAERSDTGWSAGSGATWDLRSDALRPAGWTSADAAGLPILPGLVRAEEVLAGAIRHAIRFTAPATCDGYIYPARHEAGSGSCATKPPMGLRLRLKASVDISGYGPQARVILAALKTYGMILADNGSPLYITGAPDARWDDDVLHALHGINGTDFEVVDTSSLVNG
jgi:hypothetical protein